MKGRSGILLVDKPMGPTSRGIVESVTRGFLTDRRRRRGEPRFRAGHAGTLDPLATGVLLVLTGSGTRLQPFLQGLDKRYTAAVRLGTQTDSLDREGKVVEVADVPTDPGDLTAVAAQFLGDVLQEPPLVSAIKRGGRPLHALVREGADPAPPPARPVRIDQLAVTCGRWAVAPTEEDTGHLAPDGLIYELLVDVSCGSGTYVRSLARDLARELGTLGHVQTLRRERVGPFVVEDCLPAATVADDPARWLRPLTAALPHVSQLALDADRARRVRDGAQPAAEWFDGPVPDLVALIDPDGDLVAVCRREPGSEAPTIAAVFAASRAPEDRSCA